MKRRQFLVGAATAANLAAIGKPVAFSSPTESQAAAVKDSHLKVLFMDKKDVFNTWGQLRFGATRMTKFADHEKPQPDTTADFTVRCCIRQKDGSYIVYACDGGRNNTAWRIYRFHTTDGIKLENREIVYERQPSNWEHVVTVSYSPEREQFLCLKNTSDPEGFGMYAFTSRDGTTWKEYEGNPVFREGDRWGVMWSSAVQKFLCYQKGIQRCAPKKFQELLQDSRRVITLRTSADGFHWVPDVASEYRKGGERVDGRLIRAGGPLVPMEFQIAPDELDPPDIEFYACTPFEYEGRYYLSMLNYAGCFVPLGTPPVAANGHGPALDTELWVSRDGLNWDRPFRGVNHCDAGMVEHNPMVMNGKLLFHYPKGVYGMPVDRFTYVTSRANGVFDTLQFTLAGAPLKLNAKIPGEEYPDGVEQSYVMAELIDDSDRVFPGYEREKCLLRGPLDESAIPLRWGAKDGRELSGRKARVRFFMRASYLYAVTA